MGTPPQTPVLRPLRQPLYDSENLTTGARIRVTHGLGERNLKVLSMGGKLPYIKSRA